ncbi:hypothetical protein CLV56_2011 [Mumia flava]|uniref:Serine aminopeptidase S33 domain-containing protein n=1 Tax=Mumia flava TaxID=1348852 RepID=A0A2M9BIK9_9ACTN|nr:hypothetical protein CLV56_2011 [Mumia flava]
MSAVVLGVLGAVVALVWSMQRTLIYFPDASAPPPADRVIAGATDVTFTTSDGLELAAWFVPPAPAADRDLAVLVAPGNGGHRAGRADLAEALRARGFAVLLMDYRGYGGNPGDPTEEGLLSDARAAVGALASRGYPPARTLYLGESLGCGVVAELQAEVPPAAILLRSPFVSLTEVGSHHYPYLPVRWLLRDRFEVASRLSDSSVPVTVVSGDADTIVPPEQSARVAEAAGTLVEHEVIDGAGHNDPVMFGPRVADAAVRLADATDR